MKMAYNRMRDKRITLMFISGPDKKVKEVHINKNVLKLASLFGAVFLIYSCISISAYFSIWQEFNTASVELDLLEQHITQQQKEIVQAYEYCDQAKDDIQNIIEFDGQVRSKVGIKDSTNKRLKEFNEVLVASRGRIDRSLDISRSSIL